MASKLPPSLAAARSSSGAIHGHMNQSKLPMPVSHRRSRLHSNDEAELPTHNHTSKEQLHSYPASVSSSASSSPDMAAVANGAAVVMAAPPRLELHDLSHGVEAGKRVVDGAKSTVVLTNAHEQQEESGVKTLQQQRSGIPLVGVKNVHFQARTTLGTTHLQSTSTMENHLGKQAPSRVGRYELKKKPPPPIINTHWNAGAATETNANGVDPSGATAPPAADAPVSPRRTSPISDIRAPRTSEEAVVPPPVTPPTVRVSHVNGSGHVEPVHAEGAANTKSVAEPEKMPVSPPMIQQLKTSIEPPKTPSGNPTFESFNDDDESKLSASQRVRMGLSALMTQGNGLGSGVSETMRRYSHEEGAERNQNEGVAAPLSCPRLSQTSGKQQFSMLRETRHVPQQQQQRRGSNSIASKLLPSRMCLNNLIEYVRELHQSAASLRLQLEQTRQKAKQELLASQLEASMLQESIERAEVECEQTRTRINEQEQLIHDLHAQVSDLQQQIQVMRISQRAPSFHEREAFTLNNSTIWTDQQSEQSAVAGGGEVLGHLEVSEDGACINLQEEYGDCSGPVQQVISSEEFTEHGTKAHTSAAIDSVPVGQNEEECIASPRLAKPLWEPWSSGSNSPLTTATPPMFTIAPSSLDLLPSSPQPTPETVSSSTSVNQAHVLKSIVSPAKVVRGRPCEEDAPVIPPQLPVSGTMEEQAKAAINLTAPPIFTLGAVSVPDLAPMDELQMSDTIVDGSVVRPEMDDPLQHASAETPSPRISAASAEMLHSVEPHQPRDAVIINESTATVDQSTATPPKLFHPQAHPSGKPSLPIVTAESTAVSLKKLLIDFFSEFDKGKMRMAEVYGKRYVGHEDRLFAELTRRYGKEKVSTLQRRYEATLMLGDADASQPRNIELHEAEAVQSQDHQVAPHSVFAVPPPPMRHLHGSVTENMIPMQQGQANQGIHVKSSPAKSEEAPTQKVSPKGQSPPIAGFYDTGSLPVLSSIEEDSEIETDASSSISNSAAQPLPVAAVIRGSASDHIELRSAATSQSSEQSPPASPHRVLPQRRQAPYFPVDGIVTLKTGAPPLSMRDFSQAYNAGTKSSPIRRQGEPSSGHPPMFVNFDGKSDEKKTAALFSSPASSGSVEVEKTAVVSKLHPAEQQITLECLLKELYKKHQPDKLRNVAQVANEYAGRERELVRLLKAKYGALSVKHLEENLSTLEKANNQPATATTKPQLNKKRGFISALLTRCALVLFTALSLGSAGLVLLDSSECHKQQHAIRLDADGSSAACFKLTLDLEEFEFGKIQDYAAQSYPVECFCSEWVKREGALLSRYSGTNFVNLTKMLPFSRAAVNAYLVGTPAREYYIHYAKPLIEISRDCTSVIQSAIGDVGGEIFSHFIELQDRILPSVAKVDEPTASRVDSTKDKESAVSALTKIAQASKSLLNNIQEEAAAVAENESETVVHERIDVVADAEHVSDLEINEQQPATVDSAIVEIEVRQDGTDISYPETKESLGKAVEPATSAQEPQAIENNLSNYATHVNGNDGSAEVSKPHVDGYAVQVILAPADEEEPSASGKAEQIEHVTAKTIEEVNQDPATSIAEDVVAVGALVGSVDTQNLDGDRAVEEESAEITASVELMPDVGAESDQPIDENGSNKSQFESGVDDTLQQDGAVLLEGEPVVETANSEVAPEAAEINDLVTVAHADADAIGATSEDLGDSRVSEVAAFAESEPSVDLGEVEHERKSAETKLPPTKEEERAATDFSLQAEIQNPHGDNASTDNRGDDEDDDGEDFDFEIDPWELLEMAERAAAAQLRTLEK